MTLFLSTLEMVEKFPLAWVNPETWSAARRKLERREREGEIAIRKFVKPAKGGDGGGGRREREREKKKRDVE